MTEKHALPSDSKTIAETLHAHGFSTAAFVNSYYFSEQYGFNRGFDHFEYEREGAGPESSKVVDKAIRWLLRTKDSPFFLLLHDYHVHSDYLSLPEYEQLFTRPYDGPVNGSTAQLLEVRRGLVSLAPRDTEHLIDLYSAGIRQTDADLGRLFQFLQESGLWENTVIIVTADHGEEFLEHGGVLHGRTQYDELLHIPLIIRGPGVPMNHRFTESVSINDVVPTILALLGISTEQDFDGVDLRKLWTGGPDAEARDRILFGEADHNNAAPNITRSVRYRNYKLLTNRLEGKSLLFDLAKDPFERNDISHEHEEIVRELKAQLKQFEAFSGRGQALPELDHEVRKRLEALGYVQ